MYTQSNASQIIIPYLYSKLPSPTHTRLSELLPSEVETAELHCKIHIVDPHHRNITLYEAVSSPTHSGSSGAQAVQISFSSRYPKVSISLRTMETGDHCGLLFFCRGSLYFNRGDALKSNPLEWILSETAKRSCAVRPAGLSSWVPDWRNSVQRSSIWSPDQTAPLLGISKLLLNTELSHIEKWRPSVPNCYVDQSEAYNDISVDDKFVSDIESSLQRNALAPMAITWKIKCSPDIHASLHVLNWLKSSFSTIWQRVLSPLAGIFLIPGFAVPTQRI
jgi:hypothetical protein